MTAMIPVFIVWLTIIGIAVGAKEEPEPEKLSDISETRSFDDILEVGHVDDIKLIKKYRRIVFKDFHVAEGATLTLKLKPGTVVEFAGTVTFGYQDFKGHLVKITGYNVTVRGLPGHVFDCQGDRWWAGGWRKTIPKFMQLDLSNSTVDGLHVKNTPAYVFSVLRCLNVNISNVMIDNAARPEAVNGDAFLVGSDTVRINNCTITGPHYCLLVNAGTDIVFENNVCSGGEGIAVGSVGGHYRNEVSRMTVRNCRVVNSKYGIHVKTTKDATGLVEDVDIVNVELDGITSCGIKINGNYKYPNFPDHEEGDPTPGVAITRLTVRNVYGTVSPGGANVCINVANASDWSWESNIAGGKNSSTCNGVPPGVAVPCQTD